MKQPRYEEYAELTPAWGWVLIVLLGLSLIGWGLLVYLVLPDREREWDFGTLPQTPGESAFTTEEPEHSAPVPRQIEPLPRLAPPEASERPASRRDAAAEHGP
jgi:hypothetical protein